MDWRKDRTGIAASVDPSPLVADVTIAFVAAVGATGAATTGQIGFPR